MEHPIIVAVVFAVTISFYFVTLCFGMHNTYFYLIKQDRIAARNVQLVTFYINA
jgi:hypothetical protein